jgi:hypothetical protein
MLPLWEVHVEVIQGKTVKVEAPTSTLARRAALDRNNWVDEMPRTTDIEVFSASQVEGYTREADAMTAWRQHEDTGDCN